MATLSLISADRLSLVSTPVKSRWTIPLNIVFEKLFNVSRDTSDIFLEMQRDQLTRLDLPEVVYCKINRPWLGHESLDFQNFIQISIEVFLLLGLAS